MPADRKGKPAYYPRYHTIPQGSLALIFKTLGLSDNNKARVYELLTQYSVRGDKLRGEVANWLSEWSRTHALGVQPNMLFTVQLPQSYIESSLDMSKRTVIRTLQSLEDSGILVRVHESKRYTPTLYVFGPINAQGCQDSCDIGTPPDAQGCQDSCDIGTPPDAQGCQISGVRGDTSEPVTWDTCSDIKPYNPNINIPNVNDAGTKTLRCPCGSDKPLEITSGGIAICPDCEKVVREPP